VYDLSTKCRRAKLSFVYVRSAVVTLNLEKKMSFDTAFPYFLRKRDEIQYRKAAAE